MKLIVLLLVMFFFHINKTGQWQWQKVYLNCNALTYIQYNNLTLTLQQTVQQAKWQTWSMKTINALLIFIKEKFQCPLTKLASNLKRSVSHNLHTWFTRTLSTAHIYQLLCHTRFLSPQYTRCKPTHHTWSDYGPACGFYIPGSNLTATFNIYFYLNHSSHVLY